MPSVVEEQMCDPRPIRCLVSFHKSSVSSASQPFVYPTGLVEIPMSPLGDVASFRRKEKKWKLADFLAMVRRNVEWAIEHGGVFDLLTHPSIMSVEDPKCETYELIGDLVGQSKGRAAIVGLDAIANRVKAPS